MSYRNESVRQISNRSFRCVVPREQKSRIQLRRLKSDGFQFYTFAQQQSTLHPKETPADCLRGKWSLGLIVVEYDLECVVVVVVAVVAFPVASAFLHQEEHVRRYSCMAYDCVKTLMAMVHCELFRDD